MVVMEITGKSLQIEATDVGHMPLDSSSASKNVFSKNNKKNLNCTYYTIRKGIIIYNIEK